MVILIIGSTGRLGRELVKRYPNCLQPNHSELDITRQPMVSDFVKVQKPEVLIHCAALTGIRQCNEDKEKAYRTNVEGTRNLVQATRMYNQSCLFVYISTASVFYGDRGDYTESDVPNPSNFYSLTKLLGEFVVSESGLSTYAILRVNFVSREKWPYPKAFTDRYGTYLFADDLASAIVWIIDNGVRGLVHVCGERKLSMYDLAKMTTPDVQPTNLREYSGPAVPVDMSLRSTRIRSFRLTM